MKRQQLRVGQPVRWYVGAMRLPAIVVQLPATALDKFVGLAVRMGESSYWQPRYAHIDALADATDGRYRPEQAEVAS